MMRCENIYNTDLALNIINHTVVGDYKYFRTGNDYCYKLKKESGSNQNLNPDRVTTSHITRRTVGNAGNRHICCISTFILIKIKAQRLCVAWCIYYVRGRARHVLFIRSGVIESCRESGRHVFCRP